MFSPAPCCYACRLPPGYYAFYAIFARRYYEISMMLILFRYAPRRHAATLRLLAMVIVMLPPR